MSVVVRPTLFDGHRATTTVDVAGRVFSISLTSRTKISPPENWGDVWLPLAIFPAMRMNLPLVLSDSTSEVTYRNIDQLQAVLSNFHPALSPINVVARTRDERRHRKRSSKQLFTGGVDSTFTMLANPSIDTLVYVHDLVHDIPAVRSRITGLLDVTAIRESKTILYVESDVRTMLDEYGEWGAETHGAALASIAAFVSRGDTDFYVPATNEYTDSVVRGSHPALDHLWGSRYRRIVHDGANFTRFAKVSALAAHPRLLERLRVCWQTTDSINCSTCEKCVRTMTSLEILGVLKDAQTFTRPLTLSMLRMFPIETDIQLPFGIQNMNAALDRGRDDIAGVLRAQIDDFRSGGHGEPSPIEVANTGN